MSKNHMKSKKIVAYEQNTNTIMFKIGNFIFNKFIKYRETLHNESLIFTGKSLLPHNFKKLLNYISINIQLKLKSTYIIGYPYEIFIDPSNICNLRCPLCPTGLNKPGRPGVKMSFADFKRILDEFGDYFYTVNLYNWGEPLLNPDIYKMIEYANKRRIITELNTNFNLFKESDVDKLIESGLSHLIISLDGVNQQTYEIYRKNGNFNKVINNIKKLTQKKKEMNSSLPFISIQFMVTSYNENEIEQMKKLGSELGIDNINFGQINLDNPEKELNWLPQKDELRRYASDGTRKNHTKFCSWLWTKTVINSDGSVSPCCCRLTFDKSKDFGNIFTDKFVNIWNNDKYKSARRLMGHNIESNVDLPCSTCHKDGVYI